MSEEKTIGEIINEFAELRSHLTDERKKFKDLELGLKSDMTKLEVEILDKQRELGLTSISTENFTAFQTSKKYVRMGNWDAFSKYVIESQNIHLLEKRPAKLACLELMGVDGVILSDIGLDYSQEIEVQIRKR